MLHLLNDYIGLVIASYHSGQFHFDMVGPGQKVWLEASVEDRLNRFDNRVRIIRSYFRRK